LFAWLLNLAYFALLVAVSPVILFRMLVHGKYRTGWGQKLLGRVPPRQGGGDCIWLHAVSVGEVLQLQPLLDQLAARRPDCELTISTTTATGFDVARERYPGRQVIFFPLDFSWAVRAALSRIRPTLVALVELELWPNFVQAAAERGIPIALVNGRISERSFRGYRKIRPLMQRMLKQINLLAVQSGTYAERLLALGADQARIYVTGSIKFDRVETDRSNPRTAELRKLFGLDAAESVFIAGSTQDPEERLALASYMALRSKVPSLRLILVPRHKERFESVARIVVDEFKLPLLRRSQLTAGSGPADVPLSIGATPAPVLLLDTLGELSACWGLATIAFVGGSLTHRGGQNMIEPAGFGAAVLFGPNTWNFKDVVELLLTQDAAQVVHSPGELTSQLEELLLNPARRAELGARARELVAAQRGATARTADLIMQLLPAADAPAIRAA
jgi:3-deoxy-D-manno-octulosonic-acid transferase